MTTETTAAASPALGAVQMLIGGEHVDAADGQTFDVLNPATGELLATAPLGGPEDVNRAVADGEDEGFVKVHVKRGSDRIVGGTIVASHAGEMIGQLTLAIVHRIGLSGIGTAIFPYPTQAEGIKRAAGLYTRSRLTPTAKKWLERWMALRR